MLSAKVVKQNLKLLITVNDDFKNDLDLEFKKLIPLYNKTFNFVKIKEGYEQNFEIELKYYNEKEKRANKIRKKYNLSISYHDGITQYLHDKKIHNLEREIKWKCMPIKIKNPKNKNEQIVVMPMLPESNLKEIMKLWEKISKKKDDYYREILKKDNKKLVIRKNINRDVDIYKLKMKRLTAKQIKESINKKYPNSKIDDLEVSKLVKRLRDTGKKITGGK
jgi:hypothetical protein